MNSISEADKEKINSVLKEHKLMDKINALLEEHGLDNLCVQNLQLQTKTQASQFPESDCKEGFELQWICHNGSNCELKCVPVG